MPNRQRIAQVNTGGIAELSRLRELDFDRPELSAVCLYGSAARGDAGYDSDLDLLLVVSNDLDRATAHSLADQARAAAGEAAQVCVFSIGQLRVRFEERTVFAAHLAREGSVIFDRSGALRRLIAGHPRDAPVLETAEHLYSQWEVYADLRWCGGEYLFCLSDLYALSRSGAMLALARQGEFEFDRDRVFDRLAAARPGLSDAVVIARRLRPFWERVQRRGGDPFPFRPVGAEEEAVSAARACEAILRISM